MLLAAKCFLALLVGVSGVVVQCVAWRAQTSKDSLAKDVALISAILTGAGITAGSFVWAVSLF